jgi:DNA invertase Pin-like site-specific DNA recombinase
LIVAKLDRLSRDVHFISGLQKAGISFVCADMPEMDEFTVHIFAAMAQRERKLVSIRTRDGLKALKVRGVTKTGKPAVLGNPLNGTVEQTMKAAAGRSKKANEYVHSIKTDIEFWQKKGYGSLKGLAEVLTRAKVPTSRGRTQWDATQVKRVLERLQGT